jgi:hypothetical protein
MCVPAPTVKSARELPVIESRSPALNLSPEASGNLGVAADEIAVEPADSMPIRNEDKDWIRNEIQSAAQPLSLAIAALEPTGRWKRFADQCVRLSIWAPSLACLAIALAAWNASNSRLQTEAAFRGDTGKTLTDIDGRLTGIEAALRTLQAVNAPKKVLQELAVLNQATFAKNLPALQKVSEQSPKSVAPGAGTLREIAQKLTKVDPSAAGYWSSVLQFLQFASAPIHPMHPHLGRQTSSCPTIEASPSRCRSKAKLFSLTVANSSTHVSRTAG